MKKAIVDASNYITLQHNVLSEWLYRSMCTMFKSEGGTCETFIGPLKEDQTTTPVELYWPEGQPTMTERLEQVQGTFYVGATDKDTTTHGSKSIGKGSFPETSTKRNDLAVLSSQVEEIMFKLDAHSEEVAKTQKTVEEEMKEMKHMMSNLLEQNKQLIDLLVKA
jgi:gas vesicle protein